MNTPNTIAALLDEVYAGRWHTKNFRCQVIANTLAATIDLEVYDATEKAWIARSGSAAITISPLPQNLPLLATLCLEAAAKTLGGKCSEFNSDRYDSVFAPAEITEELAYLKDRIALTATIEQLHEIWQEQENLHTHPFALKLFRSHHMKLNLKEYATTATAA